MSANPALKADVTLDLSGLTCPAPLLGARRVFDDLRDGQILMLISDCPGTRDDLTSWCRQTGNTLLAIEPQAGGAHGYFLRKGESGATELSAQITLDMSGVTCPGPIVEAKKMLKGLKSGEVMKLISTCPGVRDDIGLWARNVDVEILAVREAMGDRLEFFLKKP